METGMVWNGVLTFGFGLLGWVLKSYVDELKRVTILLNRTREEVARDYVTKSDVASSINMLVARIDNLDRKIDDILRSLAK
jgi:hypothetical protein